jgi:hypothetical protein
MTRAELIQRYFDGELPAELRLHVERTMSGREREELAALAELRLLLRACLRENDSDPRLDG